VRILSFCCTYPNPTQPNLGSFVQARLQRLARIAPVKVIAPVAWMEFGNSAIKGIVRGVPLHSANGVEVYRPRWFYPPLGGAVNALFLLAQTLGTVWKVRREFRFDVLDAHFGFPDGITTALLARILGCPFSITLRGNETMHSEFFFRGRAIRWAVRRADCVITVSERLRQWAITACGAAAERVRTIPNGVDTGLFFPRDRQAARARFHLPADRPVLLSAGYLIERKGHHRILESVRRLRDRGLPVHLVIAGGPGPEGRYAPVIHGLAEKLGLKDQVQFTGQLPPAELAELMSAADLFCLASSREGWPNVVNESLACGAPVVATDIGGVPDMLPSAKYGLIVPPNNQPALDQALEQAISRHWDREAIAAWGQSRSWEHVASEVLEQLTATVQNRAQGI
jgi:teichuronic acid biosynthesis glycosyltransferase TuaC